MTKEQFLSGVVFRIKSNRPYFLGQCTYYFDGTDLCKQTRSGVTEEVQFDFVGGKYVRVGRTGFNFIEMNELGTKSRLNFDNLVEYISN
jgi:hypothetical protein